MATSGAVALPPTPAPAHPDNVAVIGTMMRYRRQSVTVEYTDSRSGLRTTKSFQSSPAAKRFYVAKVVEGGDPKLTAVVQD